MNLRALALDQKLSKRALKIAKKTPTRANNKCPFKFKSEIKYFNFSKAFPKAFLKMLVHF